jgi:hypothetical protein
MKDQDLTPPTDDQIRARQRSRAKVMGVLLIALAILIYGISIAKMAVAS